MAAHVSDAAEGEAIPAGPAVTTVRVPGAAAGGRLGVVQMQVAAGWDGPPPHVHDVVEHVWYVLDGEVAIAIGDSEPVRYGAGACAYVPAGVAHTFSTAATGGATLLEIDVGQPLDGYFRDLASAFAPGAAVDPAVVGEIMQRHDTHPVRRLA